MKEMKITAYKGFDENLCCRGFQYEVGEEYEQEGKIKCCGNGFHACTNPFDVLEYYDANGKNRFCEVEQSGTISFDDFPIDSKQASARIRIKTEIGFAGLFKAGVKWLKENINAVSIIKKTEGRGQKGENYKSDYARIDSSSVSDRIHSSGFDADIHSSGFDVKIGSVDFNSRIHSSGDYAQIGSKGSYSRIYSSGDYARIGASGPYSQIHSDGKYAKIHTDDNPAVIYSSGYSAQVCSSGESDRVHSGGVDAKIHSSGDCVQIHSSNDSAMIDSAGKGSVICCTGEGSIAKAGLGSWIILTEWDYSVEKWRRVPVCVKMEYVDGERIKADTWYKLVNGEFKEQ